MKRFNLNRDESIILFIDQQEGLMPTIFNKEQVMKNSEIMAKSGKLLGLEGIITTQYKKGLGDIVPELKKYGFKEFDKVTFSAAKNEDFLSYLESTNKKQVLVTGVESHICVFQTVRDLLELGYSVFVIKDSIGSRYSFNYENAMAQMDRMGAVITNVETVLLDLMESSEIKEFKAVQSLIK